MRCGQDEQQRMLSVWGRQFYNRPHKEVSATNHKCEFCNITGHLEKCCNQKYPERKRQMKQRMQNHRKGFSRVCYISENSEEELDEDEMVLQVDGTVVKPFEIEGLVCGNKFRAIIDTGSPVSIICDRRIEKNNWKTVGSRQRHDRWREIC